MKKRILCLALTLVLALGLAAPALAYSTPDFSDLPADNWAYGPVMRMADQGYIQGTGNNHFSPTLKVSVAQFLTLVGRIVFPETTVGVNDTWYGPHVAACQKAGFLTGTQVNVNDVEAEITRYDMAVILRAAAKKLGKTETLAQQSQVTDYLDIPNRYTEAVLAVYGMGLIKGDQAGNFNGSNTMQRNELATVIDRLVALKAPSGTTEPEKPTETDQPTETQKPVEDKVVEYRVRGYVQKTDHAIGRPIDDKHIALKGIPLKVFYTPDGGKTSTLVAETVAASDNIARYDITFEAPESWGSYANYEIGNGFYISAETVLDGQRLVTSDLRTDGRAYKDILYLRHGSTNQTVELTPPNGEKAKFTVTGYVVAGVNPDGSWASADGYHPPEFTVQLFFKDGTLLGEAVTDSEGKFSIDCAIDALDGGFDSSLKLYYTKVSGYIGSDRYREAVIYPADGSPFLKSLVDLGVVPDLNISTPRRLRLMVGKAENLDAQQEAYHNRNK